MLKKFRLNEKYSLGKPRSNIDIPNISFVQVIAGNKNTYLESKHELEPSIWASKIRFLPSSYHRRTVCMRVELYGCPWGIE